MTYLIKLVEQRPIDIGRDPWRIIMRAAHQKMGEHWHHEMLPDHFTPTARSRYRHQLRTSRYRKEKADKAARGIPFRKNQPPILMGGQIDNVLTGYMKQQLEQQRTIRAFPSRVTIRMFGPRYITMTPYKSRQPNKSKEITMVTADQKKVLAGVLKDAIVEGIENYRKPTTTNL